jgi:hypothetical protein
MIERLEPRQLLAGNVTTETLDGALIVTGDDSANRISITRDNNDRSTLRVIPLEGTTLNGSPDPVVFSSTKGLSIDLTGGDDQVDLLGAYVRGSLIVNTGAGIDRLIVRSVRVTGNFTYDGGDQADSLLIRKSILQRDTKLSGDRGKDRTYLSQVRFARRLEVTDKRGGSIVTLSAIEVASAAQIATGGSIDHMTIHDSVFASDAVVTTSAGDDHLRIRGTLFHGASKIDAGSGSNHIDREIITRWNFNDGIGGWETGFADYDPTVHSDQELGLEAGIETAPSFTNHDGRVLKLSGNNFTDDLISYLTRRLDVDDGVVPRQRYRVGFTIAYLSDRPTDAFGQQEYLKAGAVGHSISRFIGPQGGQYDLNIDRGNQSVGGADASLVGPITNGLEGQFEWQGVEVRHVHTGSPQANANGELYLFVATESTFEVITTVYYVSIQVRLTPITTALPRTESAGL